MKQTVIGLFSSADDARNAVQRLTSNGFTMDNVDMSLSTYSGGTSSYSNDNTNRNFDLDNDRDEHESGISRFFKNLFGDDDDDNGGYATKYSNAASRGRSIVTVHAQSDDEAQKASDILDDCGAIDVDENGSDYSYGTAGAAPVGVNNETTGTTITPETSGVTGQDYTTTGMSGNDTTDKTIPIIEENLEVGKRTVQTGGVRVRSRIVEKPVEEELRLRKERVYVERNEVNRPATEADFQNFREGETEVTESAEVPVVSKEARVVEEISLNKDVDEHTETVRDTVRKTEVDIDNLEDNANRNSSWSNNS